MANNNKLDIRIGPSGFIVFIYIIWLFIFLGDSTLNDLTISELLLPYQIILFLGTILAFIGSVVVIVFRKRLEVIAKDITSAGIIAGVVFVWVAIVLNWVWWYIMIVNYGTCSMAILTFFELFFPMIILTIIFIAIAVLGGIIFWAIKS
jgi:hypothetical protein